MEHREIPMRVNAWVDEGVAPLVAALNNFDSTMLTVESCERDEDGAAYVAFIVKSGSLSEMAQRLSVAAGGASEALWRVEWYAGGEEPIAQVRVAPKAVQLLAESLGSGHTGG